jgi:glycosyltransferase involved in cell wall biosynthesis
VRILTVSNLYPPHFIGGYELGCRDVVEGLRARGHDVAVLTSTYGVSSHGAQDGSWRWLEARLEGEKDHPTRIGRLASGVRQQFINGRAFRRAVRTFRPDVIYLWNLVHVSVSLGFLAQQMAPVAYFVSDDWLTKYDEDEWHTRWQSPPPDFWDCLRWRVCRAGLRAVGLVPFNRPLSLQNVQFASQFLKNQASLRWRSASTGKVIHWGVDLERFRFRKDSRSPTRLLYVGQVSPHKGVHDAVMAVDIICRRLGQATGITLTIAGGSITPDYVQTVRRLVGALGLERQVQFLGKVPREQLPQIYAAHDIFLFPSRWEEPFAISPLEAMASGLAVVSTGTGGTPELICHGENGMLFRAGDSDDCANQVEALVRDRTLLERVRHEGRRTVEARHQIGQMVERIEGALTECSVPEVSRRPALSSC